MDLNHEAAKELAGMALWLEDSLGYARRHGQRRLVGLLEAVRVEIKLEGALLTLPLGEHWAPKGGGIG